MSGGKTYSLVCFFGGIFIVLDLFGVFALALPPTLALDVSLILVVFVVAAITEEVIFRGIMLSVLDTKMPFLVANAVQAFLFAIGLHLLVYTGVALDALSFTAIQLNLGAFLGAFFFGLTAGFITKATNNILPGIVGHAMLNGFAALGVLLFV